MGVSWLFVLSRLSLSNTATNITSIASLFLFMTKSAWIRDEKLTTLEQSRAWQHDLPPGPSFLALPAGPPYMFTLHCAFVVTLTWLTINVTYVLEPLDYSKEDKNVLTSLITADWRKTTILSCLGNGHVLVAWWNLLYLFSGGDHRVRARMAQNCLM